MLNKLFTREADKGFPAALYFLWSRDRLLLDEALEKAFPAVIGAAQQDFNLDVFDASSSPRDILDASSSLPFMTSRRLVVLKDFQAFSASQIKSLNPYFFEPSDSTCMIVLSLKDHKKSSEWTGRSFRLFVRESEIPAWVKQRAASRGMNITAAGIDCLLEFVGNDLGLLASEIEKLSLADRKQIGERDIMSMTGQMREFTSFQLIDALVAGQRQKAFRILRTLLENKPSDAAAVLGPLNWHYRQFYNLWESGGKRPPSMRTASYTALKRHLQRFRLRNFRAIFQILHEADVNIKSSGRQDLVMEVLLIRLLQAGSGN